MSYVLTVVCVQPSREPMLPGGPLVVEETTQVPNHAGYLPGLTPYFGRAVEGKGYYVFINVGKRFPVSTPLFDENRTPAYIPAEEVPPTRLKIGPEYRTHFDELLRALLAASSLSRVLVLCELNGNVTWGNPSPKKLKDMLQTVHINGPVTREEFWEHEADGKIEEPSITIIQEPG